MSDIIFSTQLCTQCTENSVAILSPSSLRFHRVGYRGIKGPLCGHCRDRLCAMPQAEIDRLKTVQRVTSVLES